MKYRLFSYLIIALLSTLSAHAQSGLSNIQRAVGYCYGDSITYEGVGFGQVVTYTIGAVATESMLAPYVGCKVVGIRIALSRSIDKSRIVMARKNGVNTVATPHVEQTVRRTYEGWQNIWLNGANEFTIEEGDELFFGYDYSETAEMVAAEAGAMCSYGTQEYEGGFCLLSDNTLYSISGAGSLCVQLIVDVTNMPRKAVSTTFFDTGFKYKKTNEQIEMFYTIANAGREDISSISIAYELDGNEPVVKSFDQQIKEGNSESFSIYAANSGALSIGRHEIKTYVSAIDGEQIVPAAKDTLSAVFMMYENTLERQKLYIEQYTSSSSVKSYYVNPVFNTIRQQHPDDIILVNMHQKGTPLAVDDANYLFDLYAYTLPSFTFNRAYYPGENYVAYDVNDYVTIDQSLVVAILNDMIEQERYMPAFARADISATYNETTRDLTVTVNGTLSPDAVAMFGDIALTTLLTEDDVRSSQVIVGINGRVSTNSNYQHNAVLRTFLSNPIGDVVTVSNDTFVATYTFKIPATWNTDNLNIVSFVTQKADEVTSSNLKEMDIIGANSIAMSQIETGIELSETVPTNARGTMYNLAGQRVGAAYRGIVIRDNKKVVVK